MTNLKRVFATRKILIIVATLIILGLAPYLFLPDSKSSMSNISSPSTPISTISASQKSQPSSKPTLSPSPTPEPEKEGCANYDLKANLGSLILTIKPDEGKTLVGDTAITIKRVYQECLGVDPGFPLTKIIKQSETSTKFEGMRPGPFHLDVKYHNQTSGYSIDIHSNDNTLTVPVSE